MKKVIMVALTILVFSTSLCSAANENAAKHSLSNYLFAKLMSENYVLMLKGMVADKDNKEDANKAHTPAYEIAKFKYQIAYTKFRVFHEMYLFLLDEKGRIRTEDEEKLAILGNDAFKAYLEFSKSAEVALVALSGNEGYDSKDLQHYVEDHITMREMLNFTLANVFFSSNNTVLDSNITPLASAGG
ncbi:hypothetical protein [Sporomusa acidovorans]|uniref:Uncharacterized protein n=1 Tax=Sporomusa acidovorans (strain ATCC 49682 / DSM 3132 / Mol) TaxID=1123286 RepID=A0ABZ3IWN1_SPOA4|nr:hypothetical protein [Sporomusa acidovorans]OZC23888.1 hypothetical protein SPACI_04050 [Sporomusa acidovorans DSM 3132]SDF54276.1 hypothetical protein SAMN04488499_105712 [Sporomusa acidovorans]